MGTKKVEFLVTLALESKQRDIDIARVKILKISLPERKSMETGHIFDNWDFECQYLYSSESKLELF
jgi:hypothetical protein